MSRVRFPGGMKFEEVGGKRKRREERLNRMRNIRKGQRWWRERREIEILRERESSEGREIEILKYKRELEIILILFDKNNERNIRKS